jgi:microcystin-dependent protein
MQYRVNTAGIFPSRSSLDGTADATSGATQTLAFVSIDASTESDAGTVAADGALQNIITNTALFSLLGTNFGGDGRTTFGVPDTGDRLVVGAGTGPGLSQRRLGQTQGADEVTLTVGNLPSHTHTDGPDENTFANGSNQAYSNIEEEIVLNYIIALQGVFPSRGPDGTSSATFEPFLGEVALFGGNFAPRGWALAEGQLLPISQFSALFSILGTQFGGDGRTTFALPDLRGRVPIGSTNFGNGARGGVEQITLNTTQMAPHTHDITRQIETPVPLPAGVLLLLSALVAVIGLRRSAAA